MACGGVCSVGWRWAMDIVGGGGVGNSVETCWRASLMVLDMCLYVFWNYFGVSMVLVVEL